MALYVGIAVLFVIVLGLLALTAMAGPRKQGAEDLGSYSARQFMNKSELKVLKSLDACLEDIAGQNARIFGQVSYGEFIKGDDASSRGRINQKRADFVIVDDAGRVLCVIEYQGAGHYGRGEKARSNAEQRDRVKRAACASAGYPLVEIPASFSDGWVKEAVVAALKSKAY